MTDIELAAELEKWFKKSNTNYQNFWHRNPVSIVIKTNLKALGNWKNKPRGQSEVLKKLNF